MCDHTEMIYVEETEFYTAGAFCAECGHNTFVEKMTYNEFTDRANQLLAQRRELLKEQRETEVKSWSLEKRATEAVVRYVSKRAKELNLPPMGGAVVDRVFGDGRDIDRIAPKTRLAAKQEKRKVERLEREIDALWREYSKFCRMYPMYAALYEDR